MYVTSETVNIHLYRNNETESEGSYQKQKKDKNYQFTELTNL